MEEKWQTFETITEYSSDVPDVVNEAWNKFVVNGFVALPQSWAADRLCPPAHEVPGDMEKETYELEFEA